MKTEDLIQIGFEAVEHYTVMNVYVYKLGRRRQLTIGNIGTPNEMMWITVSDEDIGPATDLVCLHNYDYDGYLVRAKVEGLVKILTNKI